MCGISGIYAFTDKGKEYFKYISSAVESLKKRGPDSNGIFTDNKVCLGHSRLSIIDPTPQASQPLSDVTGRYTIIFNGEIYNFREIRARLKKKGLPLKTNSDTETLLYLYIIEGEKCLNSLNGFFAFAIYDNRDDTLFIARDRIGIKPLLYYHDSNKLIFASEMKALTQMNTPRIIDKTSVSQYFQFNYIPSPYTIFDNIKKLKPGNYIYIKDGRLKEETYYNIKYNRSKKSSLSFDDAKTEIKRLFAESVEKRMIADVPLGAFLSGGIDSSVVVAEASKHNSEINTFSIGYKDEPFFDETHYAQLVADKFKTNHTVFKLTNDELYENLHNVLEYIDEPFADSSALPMYILSMHTRNRVKVALSGDGADELFSGYNKHKAHYNAINGGVLSSIVKAGDGLWQTLPKSRNGKASNIIRQLERYSKGLKLDEKDRYFYWASLLSESEANDLLKFQVHLNTLKVRKNELLKHILPVQSISDILYTDMQLVLVSDMLHKVDMMSMANSLEVRTPFLDHQLVEFVFSLPDEYKINNKMRKRILQEAYKDILPQELFMRPKHGFEVPLLKWFKTELKDELFNNYLADDYISSQGIFNPEKIKEIKKRLFSNNPGDVHAQLWALLVFQHWWKKYMD